MAKAHRRRDTDRLISLKIRSPSTHKLKLEPLANAVGSITPAAIKESRPEPLLSGRDSQVATGLEAKKTTQIALNRLLIPILIL